jgi:hypothetical protein
VILTYPPIAILLTIFTVLARIPVETILSRVAVTPSASPLVYLRPLLASTNTDPNVRCLTMKCLLHLSPKLWTGISAQSENHAATKKALMIEEHEVANIMGFLESDDPTLRALVSMPTNFGVSRSPHSRTGAQTYKVLNSVDPTILEMYRDRLTSSLSAPPRRPPSHASSRSDSASTKETAPTESNHKILRVMELLEVLATNGARYAAGVGRLLSLAETSYVSPPGTPSVSGSAGQGHRVYEVVIEKTLSYLDSGE